MIQLAKKMIINYSHLNPGLLLRSILIFFVIVFFQCDVLPQTESSSEITNPSLISSSYQIQWNFGNTVATVLNVAKKNGEDIDTWQSLLCVDTNKRVLSHHLAIKGSINGINIELFSDKQTNTNSNQVDSDKVEFTFPIPGSGLELKQVFEKSKYPYRLHMSIIVKNNDSIDFVTQQNDSLCITLGPGLGQKHSVHEQIPHSAYYYVEPITSVNGEITRYIPEEILALTALNWKTGELQWIGLHNRYFALVILPKNDNTDSSFLPFPKSYINYSSRSDESFEAVHDLPRLSLELPPFSLSQGDVIQWDFTVFSGPKSNAAVRAGSDDLYLLLFSDLWSWMRWLCLGLYHSLSFIHAFVPSWGWSIILLALFVRVILYPVGVKAQKSQKRFIEAQKKMLPELKEIKKEYKGGEQSERILQLYKKYNVSPFSGLKPLLVVLIQLPILIALYHVLGNTFELREASFLWIKTLAEPDQLFPFGFNIFLLGGYFNLLPFLMAVVTLLTFKLSPAPVADKKDKKLQNIFLIAMTLMFFFLFYDFPAGLVLYWTFANVFHLLQSKIVD
jgi:YidC/Oxa1 family membrane protein insertase